MAQNDKTIGELTLVSEVQDSTMIPVEQSGEAGRMSGQQFRLWAQQGVEQYVEEAEYQADRSTNAAASANTSVTAAQAHAAEANQAKDTIADMTVNGVTVGAGGSAYVNKSVSQSGALTLTFGIPRGNPGATGATGATPNLTIGTVNTGAPGSQASASITGTPANPVLNLTIPRGNNGAKGETGVTANGMVYFNVDLDPNSQTYGCLFVTTMGPTENPSPFWIDRDEDSDTYGCLFWNFPTAGLTQEQGG